MDFIPFSIDFRVDDVSNCFFKGANYTTKIAIVYSGQNCIIDMQFRLSYALVVNLSDCGKRERVLFNAGQARVVMGIRQLTLQNPLSAACRSIC